MNHHSQLQKHSYQRLERVLNYLKDNWQHQPKLNELAQIAALSPDHFQRLFKQWVGISPQQLVHILNHQSACKALNDGRSLMDIAYDLGLSSSSRLYELFVKIETMTPGDYKAKGSDIQIDYAFFDTIFGLALFLHTKKGLAGISFGHEDAKEELLLTAKSRWPLSSFHHNQEKLQPIYDHIFLNQKRYDGEPLSLFLKGTQYQLQVWQGLMAMAPSHITSYGQLSQTIQSGSPRSLGAAVGANPISWLIPCHRVLAQDGLLNGYRWGLTRKYAMLAHEATGHAPRILMGA